MFGCIDVQALGASMDSVVPPSTLWLIHLAYDFQSRACLAGTTTPRDPFQDLPGVFPLKEATYIHINGSHTFILNTGTLKYTCM